MDDQIAVFLRALTPESQECLGANQKEISLPFLVGRESRINEPNRFSGRRRASSVRNNDLYLAEAGLCNVSRDHFLIERRNGSFYLVDRGSMCGTIVEGMTVGGVRTGGEKKIQNGDVIIVGTSASKHVFKFVVGDEKT
jgi:pSer/pThr/pTyr-binding forkhead associated (FHA) protein